MCSESGRGPCIQDLQDPGGNGEKGDRKLRTQRGVTSQENAGSLCRLWNTQCLSNPVYYMNSLLADFVLALPFVRTFRDARLRTGYGKHFPAQASSLCFVSSSAEETSREPALSFLSLGHPRQVSFESPGFFHSPEYLWGVYWFSVYL